MTDPKVNVDKFTWNPEDVVFENDRTKKQKLKDKIDELSSKKEKPDVE